MGYFMSKSTVVAPPAKEHYAKRAKEGYGLMYPDGHVIRSWENFLKYKIELTAKSRMLDFGCWNGTHALYFSDKGFSVAGVDILESPLDEAKSRILKSAENFHLISDSTSLLDLYDKKFDLIFSNQVLYFLDNDTLLKRLDEFDRMLNSSGYVLFTMMARAHYFSEHSNGLEKNGLETIRFNESNRFAGKEIYIRFVETTADIKSLFCKFKCETVGSYDVCLEEGKSAKHFIFIGKKR